MSVKVRQNNNEARTRLGLGAGYKYVRGDEVGFYEMVGSGWEAPRCKFPKHY